MLAELLPAAVVAVEAYDDATPVQLFPEEEAIVARAVDKRRREFTTVRGCARQALARLGHRPVPILPGQRGAPQWPAGVVGTMTHCEGYRACALALDSDVRTLGVDAEPAGPLPEGVLDAIALAEELAMLRDLDARAPGMHWDRLLFSAKETVYKAWFPLTGEWLDFSEARIAIDPDAGTFEAALLVPGPETPEGRLTGFSGRWLSRRGLLLTSIVVTVPAAPSTAVPSSRTPHVIKAPPKSF
ncbi:4'-phosphopantetheinyl transferase superfamily protein [Phytohabitans sp. ZYX-F-186]|uniref:4'-phosphopantetheinyl transferase superfamily protein n=1 Tax=Phytohabitans maris TaxID=3071409 RepID=A0ABU0ZAK9_9ACTN|nr:4'-phosphopantetheinyl transferase superfamily protein [Phytohabitans sp. ZYX-F-186]MDQ7902992.1 4'-phosphopantetheinyl transferase superfamily protein [Phytohabitans sp. ZYX-F-186]